MNAASPASAPQPEPPADAPAPPGHFVTAELAAACARFLAELRAKSTASASVAAQDPRGSHDAGAPGA